MGYITKSGSPPELRRAVRSVRNRRKFFSNQRTKALRCRAAAGSWGESPIAGLSDGELQVLWLVVRRLGLD